MCYISQNIDHWQHSSNTNPMIDFWHITRIFMSKIYNQLWAQYSRGSNKFKQKKFAVACHTSCCISILINMQKYKTV